MYEPAEKLLLVQMREREREWMAAALRLSNNDPEISLHACAIMQYYMITLLCDGWRRFAFNISEMNEWMLQLGRRWVSSEAFTHTLVSRYNECIKLKWRHFGVVDVQTHTHAHNLFNSVGEYMMLFEYFTQFKNVRVDFTYILCTIRVLPKLLVHTRVVHIMATHNII